jgi:phage I-like protein
MAPKTGVASPVRGRVVEMQSRADGIWGRVDWTKAGTELLEDRAYSGISPAIEHDKNGTIRRVHRASLTNMPNFNQLTTLHHEETGMDWVKFRAALGLLETADEAAILAAVTANAGAVALHSQQLTAITKAAGLADNLSADGLVIALQSQHAIAGDTTKMAQTIISLQTQLSTETETRKSREAVAYIDGQIKAGKMIVPLRDYYITRHMADPEGVTKEIDAMPALNLGGDVTLHASQPGGAAADGLTATDRDVATKMGIDHTKFAAFKAKQATATDGRAA